ncbi:MAG: nitrophenyl compound nitroreductase subunit ArsF family protein [Rikenellaceae bacterium]
MKQILTLGLALIMMSGNLTVSAQDAKKQTAKQEVSPKVEVIYFHYTRRCETCKAVEANSKLALEELYVNEVKKGEYTFRSINLDDESSKVLAKKYKIGGQSLVVISNNNVIDITGQGFTNAKNLPKLKEEIKKTVEKAIKG